MENKINRFNCKKHRFVNIEAVRTNNNKYFIRITATQKIQTICYWSLSYDPSKITEVEAIQGVKERLINSVKIRMRSDMPIAFCLSGGIDSSTIAGIATKEFDSDIKTFSIIDDDERYNERTNIESQIEFLGCSNHRTQTSTKGFFERLFHFFK